MRAGFEIEFHARAKGQRYLAPFPYLCAS